MEVNSRLVNIELSLQEIGTTNTHAQTKCPVNIAERMTVSYLYTEVCMYISISLSI